MKKDLKKSMKSEYLIYQVYVGKKSKLYDHCIASVSNYCEEYGIDHKIQKVPELRIKPDVFATNRSNESYEKHGGFLPIYEKENAFIYFPPYKKIAIIDADIWIRPGSPNIFKVLGKNHDAGFVCEREMPITDQYRNKILNYSQMQYSTLNDVNWKWDPIFGGEFFNMGMMLLNHDIKKYFKGQTPRQFLERAEFKRFIDGLGAWKWSTDQTLLNWWVKKEKMNIKHLDWKWNALFKGVKDDRIKEAYFVHFFLKDKLPNRGENVEELMRLI
tara:strand:+ start:4627 stop:5442 length:816 start_codon:yes stop_codon:yes gene_type:complete